MAYTDPNSGVALYMVRYGEFQDVLPPKASSEDPAKNSSEGQVEAEVGADVVPLRKSFDVDPDRIVSNIGWNLCVLTTVHLRRHKVDDGGCCSCSKGSEVAKAVTSSDLDSWLTENFIDLSDDDLLVMDTTVWDGVSDMFESEEEKGYKEYQQNKKGFYTQAFSFVMEGSDFEARLCAVRHCLLTQYNEEVVSKPLGRLPGGFCTFITEVIAHIPVFFNHYIRPPRIFTPVTGNMFSTFAYPRHRHWHYFSKILELEKKGKGRQGKYARSLSDALFPFLPVFMYILMPLGWLAQQTMITCFVFFTCYGAFFPILSFSLAVMHAISANSCKEADILHMTAAGAQARATAEITKDVLLQAAASLFQEECYPEEATPLNLFRAALFVLQCMLFLAAALYGLVKARYFIRFALAITRYDLHKDNDSLIRNIRSIYEEHYVEKDEEAEQVASTEAEGDGDGDNAASSNPS
eukprot:TRINITY_DN10409_c0_g1_i4.p1 TRINITY_DN10409_c0_g1~~TRINITY_DN10409_c0_g1_i4.p1  ORF type:complete len:509 (-),score=66.56 TRINITY_DN10409_c0_g1_i4:44-1438(-)